MAKKNGTASTYISEDLNHQRAFIERHKKDGSGITLVAPEIFVQSMRDSGYRSTAHAINEFIDNAIQAGAQHIDIVLGYPKANATQKKLTPDAGGGYIAVVDDGHGMDPEMIEWSVRWGGTHRERDRSGYGRFGFGLPSAAVSISKSFTVYSRVPGGDWYAVRVDLDDISTGKLRDENGHTRVPGAQKAELPEFVRAALPEGDLPHGTVVLLDHLDRLTPGFVQAQSFREKEAHMVGLTYRDLLPRNVAIRIIDTADNAGTLDIQAIDPLFLRPDARYYAENETLAKALPGTNFRVKDPESKGKEAGTVRIRYAYMHPKFTKNGAKGRMNVRKENNGFIMMRAGRQIDVVRNNPWTVLLNNDKFWGVEIDFDPTLDELFGVTTNKQQITVADRMWDLLEENGVYRAIQQMRADYKKDRIGEEIAEEQEGDGDKPRESEEIAAKTARFRTRTKSVPKAPEQVAEGEEELKKEVERAKLQTGKTEEEVKKEIEAEPFKIWFEDLPGAPFFRSVQMGGQARIYINTAHRFYSDVYDMPGPAGVMSRVKTALELLLIAIGESELNASSEGVKFYKVERNEWSRRLDIMLEELDSREPLDDIHEERLTEREESESRVS